LLMLVLN